MNCQELIDKLQCVEDKAKRVVIFRFNNGRYDTENIEQVVEDFEIRHGIFFESLELIALVTNKKMEHNEMVKFEREQK